MANITIFKSVKSVSTGFHKNILYALERIKDGRSKKVVEELRSTSDAEIKKQLPGACFAGTFKHRSKHGLIQASGFMILDLDKFIDEDAFQDWRKKIESDQYTFACWRSPSGNGLKILVKIPVDPDNYKSYFDSIKDHYNCNYWDGSGSDISRFCFESYDPDLFHNPESHTWVEKATPDIEDIGTSSPSLPIKSENRIISNLIVWWEKKYGFIKSNRNNNLFKLAASFNDFGISQRECENVMDKYSQKDFTSAEISSLVRSAYKNLANHGTKYFEDKETHEKIEKLIRNGKKVKDISTSFPDFTTEEIEKSIESIKDNLAISDFWFYDENGKVKLSPHKYKFWLQQQNFFKYYPTKTSTYIFIEKDQNLLEETTEKQIKDHVLNYLLNRSDLDYLPYDFMARNSKYFSAEFLSFLETAEVELKEDTATEAFLYYKNCVVRVTPNKIEQIDYVDIDGFIWKRQIIDRDYTQSDHHDSIFRKFIWLISGRNVDKYNSFKSVIGYLLHSYKTSANNKAIIFNDETISENPNGGSGKGLFWNALGQMKKVSSIDGKTFEFTKSFPYQTVSTDTQLLVFDDVKKNFAFESLFSLITEGITLEYKGQDAIKLPVQRSPKILITTNYTVGGVGGSFERRKFEVEMSSYFNYRHTPLDEFGHLLFDEWSSDEWKKFDNYMIQCCQYYLEKGLVKHEFQNLDTRKFIKETSFEFYEWSSDENLPLSIQIDKKEYFEKFISEYPDFRKWLTQKRFSMWLENFGKFYQHKIISGKTNGSRWIRFDETKIDSTKVDNSNLLDDKDMPEGW